MRTPGPLPFQAIRMTTLDWNQQLPWAVPDALSYYGKYTIVHGPLENLSIGAGIAKDWGPIYTDLASGQRGLDIPNGTTMINAFVRYPVKIDGYTVGFELAGNNLTNERAIANGGYAEPTEYFISMDVKY